MAIKGKVFQFCCMEHELLEKSVRLKASFEEKVAARARLYGISFDQALNFVLAKELKSDKKI